MGRAAGAGVRLILSEGSPETSSRSASRAASGRPKKPARRKPAGKSLRLFSVRSSGADLSSLKPESNQRVARCSGQACVSAPRLTGGPQACDPTHLISGEPTAPWPSFGSASVSATGCSSEQGALAKTANHCNRVTFRKSPSAGKGRSERDAGHSETDFTSEASLRRADATAKPL